MPELEAFFYNLMPKLRGAPRLVRARDGHFMDKPDNVLSLINLATVRSLEERWGYAIDPLRFRANFYIDGGRPWVSTGSAAILVSAMRVFGSIAATDAAARPTSIPPPASATSICPARCARHSATRIWACIWSVREGGRVVIGDAVTVPDHVAATAPPPAPPPLVGQRRFICRGCYYIYDEAIGAPQADITPGTPFAEISTDWCCPDCGTDKGTFRPYVTLSFGSPVIRSNDQSR